MDRRQRYITCPFCGDSYDSLLQYPFRFLRCRCGSLQAGIPEGETVRRRADMEYLTEVLTDGGAASPRMTDGRTWQGRMMAAMPDIEVFWAVRGDSAAWLVCGRGTGVNAWGTSIRAAWERYEQQLPERREKEGGKERRKWQKTESTWTNRT